MRKEGFSGNTRDDSNLDLQQIIEILSSMEITFEARIDLDYFGEDIDYDVVTFYLPEEYFSFDYHLDLDVHGHTIRGGKEEWFYSPKSRKEFVQFIKKGHIGDE